MKNVNTLKEATEPKKVTMKTILKNPDTSVTHTIKRVRTKERRIVFILTCIILIVVFTSGFFIFSQMTEFDSLDKNNDSLQIVFNENENGMEDIVNFTDDRKITNVFETDFIIINNANKSKEFMVYLEDYIDMIEYDECFDKISDKNKIYFSIDNNKEKTLKNVFDDGKYILLSGTINSKNKEKHTLKIWHNYDINGHYHGKINISYK